MSFATFVASLSVELQNEVVGMDTFLKSLRPLKFKRTVDKRKINYVSSDYGISYAILPLGTEPTQHFGWYYLHNKETNKWYRKTDYFEETLTQIAKADPQSSKYIFDALNECTLCKGRACSAISYTYDGKQRLACYGRIIMPLHGNDFNYARDFFRQLNLLVPH